MTLCRIETRAQLAALEAPWAELDGRGTLDIFQTYDWLSVWLAHFGRDKELRGLAFVSAERLDGIVPLVSSREVWRGLSARTLRFPVDARIGVVRYDLVLGAHPEQRLRELVDWLIATRGRWDVLYLDGIAEDAPHLKTFETLATARGLVVGRRKEVQRSRVLSIDTDWADYQRRLGRHFRKRVADEARRLSKLGRVSLSKYRKPDEVTKAMSRVWAIVAARMNVASVNDLSAADRQLVAFTDDLVNRFARGGAVDLRLLEIDGRPAACLLSFVHGTVVYPFLIKYDPAFASGSPGRAIMMDLIHDAFLEGYREVDFQSDWDYLGRLTPAVRRYVGIEVYNSRVYSRLLWLMRRLARLRRVMSMRLRRRPAPGDVRPPVVQEDS